MLSRSIEGATSLDGSHPFNPLNEDASSAEACFDQLYETHRQPVHAYFFGRTGDGEIALELLQETFLRAWRQIDRLQEMTTERRGYWLFSVAKNLLTDYYRKQSVQATVQTQFDEQPVLQLSSEQEPVSQWEARESIQLLDQAIQRLPENLRTVLLMQVLGEMNSKQIGEMLEKPAGTIRYQLSAARKQLAREMRLLEEENNVYESK